MPSQPVSARFEEVDLSEFDGPPTVSWRTVGFLLSFVALVVAFGYDYLFLDTRALVLTWDPERVDWLFLFSGSILTFYLLVPLATDRDRTRRYWRRLRRNPVGVAALVYLVVFVLAGLVGPFVVEDRIANLYNRYQPPVFWHASTTAADPCLGTVAGETCYGTWEYPLGSNAVGESMSRVLTVGARVSLQVVVVAAAIVAPLGTAIGLAAGYAGGRLDRVLMRIVEVVQTLPAFVVYLMLITVYTPSMTLLLLVFGLFSWGNVARMVRSEVVQRRDADYVTAARSAGASHLTVVRNHVLPNVSATVVTTTTQLIPTLVLTEAGLGFLRLNDEMGYSWGEAIADGLSGKYASFPKMGGPGLVSPLGWNYVPWTVLFPAAALVLTVVAFAAFGDALRDVLDPREGH